MKKIIKSFLVAGLILGANNAIAEETCTAYNATLNNTASLTRGAISNYHLGNGRVPGFIINSSSQIFIYINGYYEDWGGADVTSKTSIGTSTYEKTMVVLGECSTDLPATSSSSSFKANTQYCYYYKFNNNKVLSYEFTTGADKSKPFSNLSCSVTLLNASTTFSNLTGITTDDKASPVTPFAGVTLSDTDSTVFTATITLDDNAKGTLSATTIASGTLSEVQSAIEAITFTPTQNRVAVGQSETTTITLTVTADGVNGTTTNTVETTSINDAPVLATNETLTVAKGASIGLSNAILNTTDVDNDTITYTLTSLPTGTLKLEGSALNLNETFTQAIIDYGDMITYTAGAETGSDSFTFSVSDANADPIVGTFNISVIEPTLSYTNTLKESVNNDGAIEGSITITLIGDTFAADISGDVSASNIPSGLSANFTRNSDTQITMTLAGAATAHTSATNVSDINISFSDEAFATATADNINNSTKSDLTLGFIDSVITGLTADRWNMVSFDNGYTVDTTAIDSSYITQGKEIKAYRDGEWVLNPTALKANEGVWIHPTGVSIAFSGTANTEDDFSDKAAQLNYFKTLVTQKWHLVSVQHALEWSDLTKANITPNGCDGYSIVQYYDPMTDSYNTTQNIPAGASIFVRHMCQGGVQ